MQLALSALGRLPMFWVQLRPVSIVIQEDASGRVEERTSLAHPYVRRRVFCEEDLLVAGKPFHMASKTGVLQQCQIGGQLEQTLVMRGRSQLAEV